MNTGVFCTTCGQVNDPNAAFCSRCGAPQKAASQPPASLIQPGSAPAATAYTGYGGFWIRFVAFIIDFIVVSVVTWPLRLFLFGFFGFHRPWGGGMSYPMAPFVGAAMFMGFARFIVGWIYWAGMESSSYQATLGKMALGLKVTDTSGNRLSFAHASGRYFAKILSGLILFIGYIMAGFTERKQALHDMIAGTLVLKK